MFQIVTPHRPELSASIDIHPPSTSTLARHVLVIYSDILLTRSMFSRINQLARHLSRPLPNYLHNSAASGLSLTTSRAMAAERSKRMINTAACLIIGDEVLGGKVSISIPYLHWRDAEC